MNEQAILAGREYFKNELGPIDKVVDWCNPFDVNELKDVIKTNELVNESSFWGKQLPGHYMDWGLNDKRVELENEGKDKEYLENWIKGYHIQAFAELTQLFLEFSEDTYLNNKEPKDYIEPDLPDSYPEEEPEV